MSTFIMYNNVSGFRFQEMLLSLSSENRDRLSIQCYEIQSSSRVATATVIGRDRRYLYNTKRQLRTNGNDPAIVIGFHNNCSDNNVQYESRFSTGTHCFIGPSAGWRAALFRRSRAALRRRYKYKYNTSV